MRWATTSKSSRWPKWWSSSSDTFRFPRALPPLEHLAALSTLITLFDQGTELSESDPGAMDFEASCSSPNPRQFWWSLARWLSPKWLPGSARWPPFQREERGKVTETSFSLLNHLMDVETPDNFRAATRSQVPETMTLFPFDTGALCREAFGVEFRVLQLL